MNNDESLDLLDLDNGADVDALPAATPFAAPRPKKPWLLVGVGLAAIVLVTYILVSVSGDNSSSSIEVDLDAPAIIVDGNAPLVVGSDVPPPPPPAPKPVPAPDVAKPAPQPTPAPVVKPEAAPAPQPVRVIEDRKEVKFNPDVAAPAPKPAPAKVAPRVAPKKTVARPTAPARVAQRTVAKANGGWYVQFSSHSSRALAERAQKQIVAAHKSLFAGQEFVILAAVLPNGTTTYRLRIPFATATAANSFCQNSKSDGQDCYVTK